MQFHAAQIGPTVRFALVRAHGVRRMRRGRQLPFPLHEKGSTVGGLAPRRPTHAQGAQLGARLGKEAGEGQGAPLRSAARARVPHSGAATEDS